MCQQLKLGKKAGVTIHTETHSCFLVQVENVIVVNEIKLYYNKTIGLLHGVQGTVTVVLSVMKPYDAF